VDARPPAVGARRLPRAHAASGRRFRVSACLLALGLVAGCARDGGPTPSPAVALPAPSSIGAVQGNGPRSPYEGRQLTLPGVVTGNFVLSHDGFFMQDESGAEDGDPLTSDGIFVAWSREQLPRVRRGDRVRVLGTVAELGAGQRTQTALVDATVEVTGRAGVALTVLEQPPADEADWERYEGMWLRIGAPLTLGGNHGLARFGELEVAFGGRARGPTTRYPPGPKATQRAERNAQRMLVLDDNRRAEYPDRLWFLPEPPSAEQPLRAGSVLHDVEGVLDHRRDRRLQLTAKLKRIEQAPRPAAPQIDGALRLAALNVLNLFNGDGQGGGFPTSRGAASHEEYLRQRDKIVAMILGLKPDVAALAELENDGSGPLSAEQQLVDALNAALGADGDYAAVPVDLDMSGSDSIRVGLIYRRSRVQPQGAPLALQDGPFADRARPPLAQAFVARSGGSPFTVVSTHFKSKGGCNEVPPEQPGDRDRGDGQACWNALRTTSAEVLGRWLASDPAGTGSDLYAILGDLNANTFEDPLLTLRRLGYRDAIDPDDRGGYTFVFRGLTNRLDHAMLSPALYRRLAGAAVWHLNADESELFDYRLHARAVDLYQPDPWASSDHDPLLVVLKPL
jgi:uncharacterized protein